MIGEGLEQQAYSSDRRAVDEWKNDTIQALGQAVMEGGLLLDGDGGPDALAGLEDQVQRLRVMNLMRMCSLYIAELTQF